ncbi:Ig-like domain-containing protein [Nakamurella sp. A5-74]|uniref:Ig-like domain-containing protein n=1 Tax=Nakamurella sp. A5-74 TaxID=3158264 RepID=A0AAU8DMJ6_9ACTN
MSLLPALRRRTRLIALVPLAALLLTACAHEEVVVVRTTVTPGQPSSAVGGGVAQPSSDAPSTVGSAQPTSKGPGLAAQIQVISNPEFGKKDIGPNDPISVTVFSGTISAMKVEASDGTPVAGEVSADKTIFTVKDRLAYGLTYNFAGTATAPDGTTKKIGGKLSTVNPADTVRTAVQIPEGGTVGVGAPISVTFCPAVQDKAAAQKALEVTTDKKDIPGSWGWLADEEFSAGEGVCSQAHYRTKDYWPANTKVKLTANLSGVNYGNGWGREDLVRNFTIGRSLIMRAEVSTMRLVVMKDGAVFRNYKASYGKESVPGRTTVSGIHIVQKTYPTFKMCNPAYGYCNLLERWAIRINNNGEFIHENEKVEQAGLLGVQNVSHGCINLGGVDAKELYDTVIYGDPVEVSGTSVQISAKDYIYDWGYSWDEWQTLSAL